MSLYEGFFGAKKKSGQSKEVTEHFQIRPFAQHALNDEPAVPPPQSMCPSVTYPGEEKAAQANGVCHGNGMPVAPLQGGPFNDLAVAAAAAPPPAAPSDPSIQTWNAQYDRSLSNIQSHIHAIAGAVAMLDAVEHKMIAIKLELQRIRDANLLIDGNKVLAALEALSDYVNQAITSVDDQCVNMLRDAKLEIRFAAVDSEFAQPDGVALTMISLDRLLDYKIKAALTEGLIAEETPEFIDDICAIVSSNIQILTSVMLALFASRDYTQAVTKLAAREKIIPAIDRQACGTLPHGTIDQLQFDDIDQQLDEKTDQFQQGRASLTELLKNVRENRGELGASFN